MTAAWICQRVNGETEAFDTEKEAEARASYLVQTKTVTAAVVFRVDVEPPVGRWRKSA